MLVKGNFWNLIWAEAGYYKSISNQMSKLLEGGIRELCTNAANLASSDQAVMMIFLIISSWWDGKLFLYYPVPWTHPLLPKPYHTIQPVNRESLTLTLSQEKLFFKSSLLLFLCDIYPLGETFFRHLVVGVQCPGTVTKNGPNAACTMILRIGENTYW